MKVFLMTLSLFLSVNALASELNFEEPIEVKKVVMMEEILINDLIKLYNDYDFEGDRMIAGKFEKTSKKSSKKTYLDGLRSKLEGSKGIIRF